MTNSIKEGFNYPSFFFISKPLYKSIHSIILTYHIKRTVLGRVGPQNSEFTKTNKSKKYKNKSAKPRVKKKNPKMEMLSARRPYLLGFSPSIKKNIAKKILSAIKKLSSAKNTKTERK